MHFYNHEDFIRMFTISHQCALLINVVNIKLMSRHLSRDTGPHKNNTWCSYLEPNYNWVKYSADINFILKCEVGMVYHRCQESWLNLPRGIPQRCSQYRKTLSLSLFLLFFYFVSLLLESLHSFLSVTCPAGQTKRNMAGTPRTLQTQQCTLPLLFEDQATPILPDIKNPSIHDQWIGAFLRFLAPSWK